ncbi:gpi-anchored cell surface glyco protein [Rutstroemia sp. NJR-2017a WRK4]|nr:gpi-anchored cell surface glyco protein [Rutstroemia sp. NJR-2017a WRK4]
MSLNGLDDAKVKEAHDAAVGEPGGCLFWWAATDIVVPLLRRFLLKYASRDEIELMGRGNGGIVEIRNAIGQYEEPSPLFGFLRYRRRNVVIKYVPDGCSRLVQARVTVHFNAVTEKFAPHDTTFEITDSKELRDTTLSAACSLHTASGSISSSTSSLRRRRLMEIAEDEEEDSKINRQSTVQEERPPTAQTTGLTPEAQPTVDPTTTPLDLPNSNTYPSLTTETDSNLETSPPRPRGPLGLDLDTSPPPPREPRESEVGSPPQITTIDEIPRTSSQSARPDLYSLTSYGSYGKRKIKLGPRPSLDTAKAHIATGTSTYRPVSTLPQGLKIFSTKGSKKEKGKISSQESGEPPSMILPPPPIPENGNLSTIYPSQSQTNNGRPNTSSGVSIRSTISTKSTTTTKVPTITPEKARLMKAMELRKKQLSAPATISPSESAPKSTTSATTLATSPSLNPGVPQGTPQEIHDTLAMLTDMAKADDSTVALDSSSTMRTDESDATRIDSYPASPIAASEKAESTRASSISDSTDETVQEAAPSKAGSKSAKEALHANLPTITATNDDQQTAPLTEQNTASIAHGEPSGESETNAPSLDARTESASAQESKMDQLPGSESEPAPNASEKKLLDSPFEATSGPTSKKRTSRKSIEPIKTDFDADRSAANTDNNFSSDDELMDELQSAVFQDAKPMSVAKSPVSPVFPRTAKPENKFSRTVSNPLQSARPDSELLNAQPGGARPVSRPVSASANFLNRISQQPISKPVVSKKINVGSGVSQRIKALEKLTTLMPEAAAPTPGPAPTASPAFFSVRRSSVLPPTRTPSVAERTTSLTKNVSPSNVSRDASPDVPKGRGRSSSFQTYGDTLKPTSAHDMKTSLSRSESVSVTARIIRDPDQPFPQMPETGKDPSDFTPLALKESPLIIDHQKASASSPKEIVSERRLSTSSKSAATTSKDKERRSSVTVVKDLINDRRSSFAERRRSTTIEPSASSPSTMSPTKSPSTHVTSPITKSRPLSMSSHTSREYNELSPPPTDGSSSSTNDEKSEKKSNRASRMMKRMSSSLSSGRKAIAHAISPTVREESEPPVFPEPGTTSLPSQTSEAPSPTTTTDLGDVNVQFPDSLLWKRRSMVLDSQGLLVLTAGKEMGGGMRRFHLSEFRSPIIPDIDIQELPNSIVLGFLDGGELQIACEDRSGQTHVLSGKF